MMTADQEKPVTDDGTQSILAVRGGVSAVILRGARVLLVERARPPLAGLWSLPGGRIDPGETAIEAIRREIIEETGIVPQLRGLIDVHDVILRDGRDGRGGRDGGRHVGRDGASPRNAPETAGAVVAQWLLAVFHGTSAEGEPVAASDARKARFVPLEEIDGLPMTDGTQAWIRRALEIQQLGDPAVPIERSS